MTEDVVRAKRFELVDDEGTTLGALYVGSSGQPTFSLADKDGEPAISATVREEAVALYIKHPASTNKIMLASTQEGNSAFTITDATGQPRIMVAMTPDGTPSIVTADEDGNITNTFV